MRKKLEEGIDFYYNEDGFVVLTEKFHLGRGYCCGNGCKHCPFDYENVPDQAKRERLRAQKRDANEQKPNNEQTQAS
ncbi:hypothetical protein LX64_00035 [Chitinophaga skermanii]|uniref:Uncharacterized protein n=1 Tax=Chitinophaga skermanii TaxID=331697 RepID=A0A327R3W8_9BACT|nr:DUF5522 domain-containing protein [Chitinophaga skermanii]RAJ10433.1 hypothetical protein LX64_00035 [Chitinophaga skermanii]